MNKEIKLGIIGESSGNGHPFSWQAICNDYDPKIIKECGYPAINLYLSKHDLKVEKLSGCIVSSIWTENPSRASFIASVSDNCSAANSIEELSNSVDGIIIARDDYYPNEYLFNKLYSFKKPLLFDKQISFSKEKVKEILRKSIEQKVPIFSGSSIGYDTDLKIEHLIGDENCIKVKALSPKNWFNYGIHVLDPILRSLEKFKNFKVIRAEKLISTDKNIDGITLLIERQFLSNLEIDIMTSSDYKDTFSFEGFNINNQLIHKKFHNDTFNTFKRYLQKFVNITMYYHSPDFIFEDFLKESEYNFFEKSVEYIELALSR